MTDELTNPPLSTPFMVTSPYRFFGKELDSGGFEIVAYELFAGNSVVGRSTIVSEVYNHHRYKGGIGAEVALQNKIKRAFTRMFKSENVTKAGDTYHFKAVPTIAEHSPSEQKVSPSDGKILGATEHVEATSAMVAGAMNATSFSGEKSDASKVDHSGMVANCMNATSFSGEKAELPNTQNKIKSKNPTNAENLHVKFATKCNVDEHPTPRGWLYFVVQPGFPGVVKVGNTQHPSRRLGSLRREFHVGLEYLRIVEFAMYGDAIAREHSIKHLLDLGGKHIPVHTVLSLFNATPAAKGKTEWYRLTHSEVHTLADLFQRIIY